MVFKKPGNSRDDKSNNSAGRRTGGSGHEPRNSSSPRTRNANSGFKKSDDSAPKKRFAADGDKKPFTAGRKSSSGGFNADEKPKRNFGSTAGKKPFGDRSNPGEGTSSDRPFKRAGESRGSSTNKPFKKSFGGDFKGSDRSSGFKPREGDQREGGEKKFSRAVGSSRTWADKPARDENNNKPFRERREQGGERSSDFRKPAGEDRSKPFRERKEQSGERPSNYRKPANDDFNEDRPKTTLRGRNKKAAESDDSHLIRLNRYISNAGICSRRKADELIAAGVVSVNGEVISELGHKVDPSKDVIRYNGETLKREKMVYVLLNKPKDYITTTEDPQERRTVMHLVDKASKERIYPVGRLDRNTTGLILMTNDGELADKLSHPRNSITKIYQVELNKALSQGDLNKIEYGLELEDGLIKPDMVSYVQGGSKREIGIQIHSGKNRIVRRIFEHLGYEVVKLDRTIYANLTKKDLPRGRWRFLEEKEVIQLKHLVKV
ncbi:pseudouridine synthase [Mucilaginibacter terrae]|uniref:Pseudouridine synthase n=1 Tax=Mucilaginibacter terrae TaxID=1955052 RepID=A0ABU3GX79_9SPHI|nr:pseudouridine synthase [Mucilaginibacter terrae]MDT3404364.1 23S rRNA pseudouridine2605 synthase [Mucilaginibacter terrae]